MLIVAAPSRVQGNPSVILRCRQDQFAAIEEVAAFVADFFEEPGVYFQPRLEFVVAKTDRIPDSERAFAIKFEIEINQPVFALLVGKAPHLIQLYAHPSSGFNNNSALDEQCNFLVSKVTLKIRFTADFAERNQRWRDGRILINSPKLL